MEGESRDAPGAASSPPGRLRSSERGGSASGRSSGARERASVSSAPLGVEEPGAACSQWTPVARSAPSSVASPHSSLHALRGGESRVFGGLLPFAILPCFPVFGPRNKEGSWSPLSVGQLSRPVSSLSLSLVVKNVVGVTRIGRCLLVSGRGMADHSLLTAIGLVAFTLARCLGETGRGPWTATGLTGVTLGVTGRGLLTATGLDGSVRVPMLVGEVAVTGRGHAIPLAALYGRFSPLTARGQRIEADEPDVSCGRVWRRLLSTRLPLSQKRQLQWLLLLWGVL